MMIWSLVKVSDWNSFRTNRIYSEICMRTHPSESYNPRLWIRMNPNQFFNSGESDVVIIRIDSDWEFILNHSDLGFIRIQNFVQIRINFQSILIKRDRKLFLDRLGLVWIEIFEWIGLNLIYSEWISIRNFYQWWESGNLSSDSLIETLSIICHKHTCF